MTAEGSSTHPFDLDTAVDALGGGRFAALISDRWDTPAGPNGGYSLATAVRSLGAVLPHPDPVVVTATYLRPVHHGDAEISTEVIRSGRRLSAGEARLIQDGKERIRVVASFADLGATGGTDRSLVSPPALPPPEECPAPGPVPGTAGQALTISQRFEYRMPEPLGFPQGTPSGRASFALWMRFREDRDPDVWSLPSFADGAPPAVMELGELASTTVELTLHIRRRPAPGWIAMQISTDHVIGGYHEETIDLWDSTGRLVAQSRQVALLPLHE